MSFNYIPETIPNWINGQESEAMSRQYLAKLSPHTGKELCKAARSGAEDVQHAVDAAVSAQPSWERLTPVQRGEMLHDIAQNMRKYQKELAAIVALETGMSSNAALGEVGGAIAQG